jgi:hypothetical protein
MASPVVFPADVRINGDLACKTFTPPSASVVTASLASNAVTAPKLTATLATGFIPLSLHEAREMFTNDYGVAADGAAQGSGGVLAKDTTPILERINGATDKQARLNWAATNVDEIQWNVISPPDLDKTQPVYVKARGKMSAGVDTPVLTIALFEDIGGSNLGGSSDALSSTQANVSKAVTVTADPQGGTYKSWAISIKPAAHGTDAVYLTSVWLEYTRL